MKCKVIGRKYSDVATYARWDVHCEFPRFEETDEQTWEIEADTMKSAEKWLASKHPEYYMGANIICENGDFACLAVPCEYYGNGSYETLKARVDFVTSNVA